MYRFFVQPEQIHGKTVKIQGSEVNHIKNVLRMKSGEQIRISDGKSMDYLCEIETLEEDAVYAAIMEEWEGDTELPVKIILYQGLPKGEKLEWIIQKSVELGVYKIHPVAMKFSVAKVEPKKEESKKKRWNAIAKSAAEQSKRLIVPEVGEVLSYKECLKEWENLDLVLVPYESAKGMETIQKTLETVKNGMKIGILIGPEGGISEQEIEEAKASGAKIVSLGKRILRTETAALAMLSILMYHIEIETEKTNG